MSDFSLRHPRFNIDTFIAAALREDAGDGDHTSLATVPANHSGKMQLLAKEKGIVAGVTAAIHVLRHCDSNVKITVRKKDGSLVKAGDVVMTVEGKTRKLLLAERLLLNIVQRMSGIATRTHAYQQLCKGTKARVIDTRKTTPGFRFFEKWAVVIGGGANHRFGLYDMVLIKDNHVDFAGGIPQAIDAANSYLRKKKKKLSIEIETRSLEEVKQVLNHGKVHRIMLDNFTVSDTRKAVRQIAGRYEVESSGGITEKTIAAYARCGVDFISVGALTHQVRSMDFSFKALKR